MVKDAGAVGQWTRRLRMRIRELSDFWNFKEIFAVIENSSNARNVEKWKYDGRVLGKESECVHGHRDYYGRTERNLNRNIKNEVEKADKEYEKLWNSIKIVARLLLLFLMDEFGYVVFVVYGIRWMSKSFCFEGCYNNMGICIVRGFRCWSLGVSGKREVIAISRMFAMSTHTIYNAPSQVSEQFHGDILWGHHGIQPNQPKA